MKTYKIAIVGAGRWAENYCRTINDHFPQINLVAMVRQKNERPNFIPATTQLHTNLNSLFSHHIKLDGIIIASSNPGEVAQECLKYDIPILAEKPLITDRRDLKKWDGAKRIMVNYTHLFAPAFIELQKIVAGKEILGIYSEGCNRGPVRQAFSSLYDYGVHDLSQILSIVGQKEEMVSIRENITEHGSLYEILLTYSQFQTKSLVGNGAEKKERSIHILYDDNGFREIVYDDTTKDKLMVEGVPIHYDSTPPLVNTIRTFLRLINGEEDKRFGLDLTRRIAEILSASHKSA